MNHHDAPDGDMLADASDVSTNVIRPINDLEKEGDELEPPEEEQFWDKKSTNNVGPEVAFPA